MDVFSSCLDSHSDGTRLLVSNSNVLNFSKSVLLKKQINLHFGWPEGELIFSKFLFFGLTIPLKVLEGDLYFFLIY